MYDAETRSEGKENRREDKHSQPHTRRRNGRTQQQGKVTWTANTIERRIATKHLHKRPTAASQCLFARSAEQQERDSGAGTRAARLLPGRYSGKRTIATVEERGTSRIDTMRRHGRRKRKTAAMERDLFARFCMQDPVRNISFARSLARLCPQEFVRQTALARCRSQNSSARLSPQDCARKTSR